MGQPNVDPLPAQSSGAQKATLLPPTTGLTSRFLDMFRSGSSYSSPSVFSALPGIQRSKSSTGHRASRPFLVPESIHPRPHSSGSTALESPLTTNTSSVWDKALEIAGKKLIENNLPLFDLTNLTSQSAEENIGAIVKGLNNLLESDKQKYWSYTWLGKKVIVMERLREILKIVDKYSKVVDIAVQSYPQVAALVWACVRAIIQVASNHVEVIESLEVAIAVLVEQLSTCESYAKLYYGVPLGSQSIRKRDSALPEFYAAVIVFGVKARAYFEAGGRERFFSTLKSFEVEFLPFIEEISAKEKVIREYADVATMEKTRKIEEITSELNDHRILKLLKLLTPLEPLKRHQDVKAARSKNAGTWLLRLESFGKWRDSPVIEENGNVFCCYGIPGAGKTVISSVVVDDLRSRYPNVACLYADYKDQNDQTLVNILGAFLRQFLATQKPIPDEITKKLCAIQHEGGKVGLEDNIALLKIELHQLKCVFICIDAVDELDPNTRQQLLDVLKELGTEKIRLFLTGRGHIESEIHKWFQIVEGNKVTMSVSATQQDIEEFVRQKINQDSALDSGAMDEALASSIVDTIIEKSQGMFLLSSLHIKMVLGMPTKAKRRAALETLPTDLYDTFQGIISRVRECPRGQAELGIQVLMWLHFAYRPLQLAELQHALAVEKSDIELDVDNIPSPKALLDCCLGLVLVDEETLTVRFVHYTLEEYFQKHSKEQFPNGCNYIAETCLTYLNFGKLRQHCTSLDTLKARMNEYILLEYAALYWGNHVQQQYNSDLTKAAMMIVRHESEYPPCAIQALYFQLNKSLFPFRGPVIAKKFSGAHVIAYFGLSQYTDISRCHMELKDECDRTPLSWAAERGHEYFVKMLIERYEVDIDAKDNNRMTPLLVAAATGREAVVRLLIERGGVEINAKDNYGRTPLFIAASHGYEAVVRLLIKQGDVDINAKNINGMTPLSVAAAKGHEAVIRLLIERGDVDINTKDKIGWTPHMWAELKTCGNITLLLIDQQGIRNSIIISSMGSASPVPLISRSRSPRRRLSLDYLADTELRIEIETQLVNPNSVTELITASKQNANIKNVNTDSAAQNTDIASQDTNTKAQNTNTKA